MNWLSSVGRLRALLVCQLVFLLLLVELLLILYRGRTLLDSSVNSFLELLV